MSEPMPGPGGPSPNNPFLRAPSGQPPSYPAPGQPPDYPAPGQPPDYPPPGYPSPEQVAVPAPPPYAPASPSSPPAPPAPPPRPAYSGAYPAPTGFTTDAGPGSPWGSLGTQFVTPSPGQAPSRGHSRRPAGGLGSQHFWIRALRVVGLCAFPFFLLVGVYSFFQVAELSQALSGGFITQGEPNYAMATLTMVGVWLLGVVAATLTMVFVHLAEDVAHLKAKADSSV